jgi:hypothetical protein
MMKNDENSGTVPGRHQFIDGKLMFIAPRGIYIYSSIYSISWLVIARDRLPKH